MILSLSCLVTLSYSALASTSLLSGMMSFPQPEFVIQKPSREQCVLWPMTGCTGGAVQSYIHFVVYI